MKVYIEYAIINNLAVDYLLLSATAKTLGKTAPPFRIAVAAILGTIFALFFPMMELKGVPSVIFKLLLGEVLVLIAMDFKSVGGFFAAYLLFLAYTFALGGAMIGIGYLAGAGTLDFTAYPFSDNLNADIRFGAIILFGYLAVKLLARVFGTARKAAEISDYQREVGLFDGGESAKLKGIIDTGNRLYDGRSGKPVSVICRDIANELILKGVLKMRGAHYVKCSTVSGSGKILVFEIDRLVIYYGSKRNIIDNAMIGVSPEPVAEGADVILNCGLLAGET